MHRNGYTHSSKWGQASTICTFESLNSGASFNILFHRDFFLFTLNSTIATSSPVFGFHPNTIEFVATLQSHMEPIYAWQMCIKIAFCCFDFIFGASACLLVCLPFIYLEYFPLIQMNFNHKFIHFISSGNGISIQQLPITPNKSACEMMSKNEGPTSYHGKTTNVVRISFVLYAECCDFERNLNKRNDKRTA